MTPWTISFLLTILLSFPHCSESQAVTRRLRRKPILIEAETEKVESTRTWQQHQNKLRFENIQEEFLERFLFENSFSLSMSYPTPSPTPSPTRRLATPIPTGVASDAPSHLGSDPPPVSDEPSFVESELESFDMVCPTSLTPLQHWFESDTLANVLELNVTITLQNKLLVPTQPSGMQRWTEPSVFEPPISFADPLPMDIPLVEPDGTWTLEFTLDFRGVNRFTETSLVLRPRTVEFGTARPETVSLVDVSFSCRGWSQEAADVFTVAPTPASIEKPQR